MIVEDLDRVGARISIYFKTDDPVIFAQERRILGGREAGRIEGRNTVLRRSTMLDFPGVDLAVGKIEAVVGRGVQNRRHKYQPVDAKNDKRQPDQPANGTGSKQGYGQDIHHCLEYCYLADPLMRGNLARRARFKKMKGKVI